MIEKNWKKNSPKKKWINLIKMSDIEKVKKLRDATGAGIREWNSGIRESGGDLNKAIEILRVKGISKA